VGNFNDAWILTGPTASGKSALALQLASRLDAEIVSADSMTLYRGLDIGTAKPSPAELAQVPHHLIDVLDVWQSADVAWWRTEAAAACTAIRARGRRPLIVGGTPFYLKVLAYGLFEGPKPDPVLRASLEAEARTAEGAARLYARLAEVDPKAAARLHPNDHRRVIRALEVFEQTGQPLSDQQTTWGGANFGTTDSPGSVAPRPTLVLDWPTDQLNARIDQRIDQMLALGWLDETQRLLQSNPPPSRQAIQAIGYQELGEVLRGERTLADATAWIKIRTHQLAKRQRTWFRKLPRCRSIPASVANSDSLLSEFLSLETEIR